MNYESSAKQILNVLGKDNIQSATHCMTRLRFVLKDEAGIDDERVKKIPGVMGVMRKGGQYQIIIGNEVAKCFAELKKLGVASSDEPAEKPKEKMTLKGVGNAILDYISGSMSALIPALIGGGMIRVLLMILSLCGVINESHDRRRCRRCADRAVLPGGVYIFAVPSPLSLPQFISESGGSNFTHALIVAAVSVIVTALITWFTTDPEDGSEPSQPEIEEVTPQAEAGFHDTRKIASPLSGQIIPLAQVNDATFAEEMMGKGMAVIPDEGVVYAPFDGTVEALFLTGHAIGLKSEGGVQLLIRFDLDAIRQAGYDVTTPVIVTNSNDYIDVIGKEGAHADATQPLLYVM